MKDLKMPFEMLFEVDTPENQGKLKRNFENYFLQKFRFSRKAHTTDQELQKKRYLQETNHIVSSHGFR